MRTFKTKWSYIEVESTYFMTDSSDNLKQSFLRTEILYACVVQYQV